jgi:6-pyruvoyltetrahydropterin/6-carboxytetrahydropterin synthase
VRRTTIELAKEAFKFSAGHFTIFGPGHRERLHGHNFTVACSVSGPVGDDGMMADYTRYKELVEKICAGWNEYFLLPGESPLLFIEGDGQRLEAIFGDERIPFLTRDVLILPVRNVTLEELAALVLDRLVERVHALGDPVDEVVVKVSSGPGQSASASWATPEA